MRPYPITVLQGGINRLRVKGGAAANSLYDLQNAWITNSGSISPREGTIRVATLDSSTVGLAVANGQFNIFSSAFSTATLPTGYVLNVLSNPSNTSSSPVTIWYAKPFMGFPYVVAQFSDKSVHHYWLQNSGTWTSSTDYTSASIVLPPVANGLAYQGVRDFPPQPLWTPNTTITSGSYIEPNTPTGFVYQAILVTGSPVHTSQQEPVWPTAAGAIIQEFGDFDLSTTDAGTTQVTGGTLTTAANLGANITDRYGNSNTISNAGIFTTSSTPLLSSTLASTKITTWKSGTNYAPGAVVVPTSSQGAFVNAIPNGDFEGGSGAGGWTFTDPGGVAQWAFSAVLPYQGSECIGIPGGTSMGPGGAFATMTSYSLVTPGQSVTATAYLDPNNSGANLTLWLQLNWYNAADVLIGNTGNQQNEQTGGGYRKVAVTGIAPTGAAHCRVAIGAGSGTTSRNTGFADLVSWNLATPAPITNFLFEAIQPAAGSSAATEPSWPTILGNTVIDNTVTWKAIGTSIITWQAIPLMQSGLVAPTFPLIVGNTVSDFSTYSNQNGYITSFCSMSWQCVDRHVSDAKCPNTVAVAIGASHVFAGDNDLCDYSAAVNPIDWSSTNNAGYLPTGLNNYGDNPVTALALYRGNLIVFNAGGYQMWQIDPDPQNMAFLDAQPVGSIYPRAAQSVANDLLFLTEVGVRNLGTIGATANMAIGNTGQPIDPLIKAQFPATGGAIPGDPFFGNVSLLLHFAGANGSTNFLDSSPNNNTGTVVSPATITTTNQIFAQEGSIAFGSGFGAAGISYPDGAGSVFDMGSGDFTIEFWIYAAGVGGPGYACYLIGDGYNIAGQLNIFYDANVTSFRGSIVNSAGTVFTSVVNASPAFNAWNACALVRRGTSLTMFLNGVGAPPTTITGPQALQAPASTFVVGSNGLYANKYPNGQIAELRITKGVARYTANYTPPVVPTTAIPVSAAFIFPSVTYYRNPLSLYYPGRGQYWLIFGPQAFVLTINGNNQKSWSRYIFPDSITDWALNSGVLYLRTAGNLVWQFDTSAIGVDDSAILTTAATPTPFNGVVQWPYLDMGALGRNKMLVGVDLVGEGNCSIQVAYNQTDKTTFNDNQSFAISTSVTAPYFVTVDDTVPGEPLAIPVNAPSFSVILTFTGSTTSANAWSWQAANLYVTDAAGAGALG